MMKKLDQRGAAALEFGLIAVALFTFMFAVFDLGRYVLTMQSLRMLANAEARANMIYCYTPAKANGTSPSACTGDYLPDAQKQTLVPALYGGVSPTVSTTAGANALTVTASQPSFTMLIPIWGTALKAAASTSIPF
jgi:Flp pilus assembly protein TadG